MAVDVVTETTIDRPCADVAAYAGDPTNAPQWYANIASVRWQTAPPVRVGSRIDFVAGFLRQALASSTPRPADGSRTEVLTAAGRRTPTSCPRHGGWFCMRKPPG